VVVGGQPGNRGVVAAASYEARVFGLRSAMPTAKAVRLCPHAVFVRPRFEHYRDGQCVIPPERAERFIAQLPVGAFHGVGSATEARLHALGIETGADLARWGEAALVRQLGKNGSWLHRIARGIDERPVEPHHERRSIGSETTFLADEHDRDAMLMRLRDQADEVATSLQKHQLLAGTLAIKVRYPDFTSVTRQCKLAPATDQAEDMVPLLPFLLERTEATAQGVRLLGVSVAGLIDPDTRQPVQLNLPLETR